MSDRFGNIPIESSTPAEKKPAPERRPSRQRRTRKPALSGKKKARRTFPLWLFVPLALLAVYSLAGFYGVPYYFQEIFPKTLFHETGFHFKANTVRFNPYTFRLRIGGADLSSLKGEELLAVESLAAKLDPIALLRHDFVCTTVAISRLSANLVRNSDGSYNFSSLLGGADAKARELIDFSDLPFLFSFNNITVRDGSVRFTDIPTGKNHVIEAISLDLPTFSNFRYAIDQQLQPHFSAVVNGSPVEFAGETTAGADSNGQQLSTLKCNLHNIDLGTYVGYLPFAVPVEVSKGQANGTLDFTFATKSDQEDRLTVNFSLQISGSLVQTKDHESVLEVPEALVSGSIRPASRNIHFTNITIKNPQLTLAPAAQLSDSIRTLLPVSFPAQGAEINAAMPFSSIVDLLIIDNGNISRAAKDSRQQPASLWQSCSLSIKNYAFNNSAQRVDEQPPASFSVSAESPRDDSYVTWQGTFSDGSHANGALQLVKFPAEDLWPFINSNKGESLQGLVDLNGELALFLGKTSDNKSIFTLTEATAKIAKFSLLTKKKPFLTAPLAEVGPVSIKDGQIQLGNIVLRHGFANLDIAELSPTLKRFTTPQFTLAGFDFDGSASVVDSRNDTSLFSLYEFSARADLTVTPKEGDNNFSVLAKTASGAILKGQGEVSLNPFEMTARVGFAQFPLVNSMHFFTGKRATAEISGKLSGKGTILLPQKSYAGELLVSDFGYRRQADAPSQCQKALLQHVSYTSNPSHVGIAKAEIDQCALVLPISAADADPVLRFSAFLQELLALNSKETKQNQKISLSAIDIQEVHFADISATVQDNRCNPPWQTKASQISGSIVGLHSVSSAEKSSFTLTGKIADSPLDISGETSFLAKTPVGQYQISLAKLPLAAFQQQLSENLDLDFSQGTVDTLVKTALDDDAIKTTAQLRITGARPSTKDAPSALTLALLTGKDNSFVLNVENSSTRETSANALVEDGASQFQTLVVKSTLSPLLLASGDFTDLIGHEYAEFTPGTFTLTDTGRDILIRYAALLAAHPHIGLVLSGGMDRQADRQALKSEMEAANQKQIDEENRKNLAARQEEQKRYQENLAKQRANNVNATIIEKDIPPQLLQEFVPRKAETITVTDQMLVELAQKRLAVIREYFVSQAIANPERISAEVPQQLADIDESSGNGVAIRLQAIIP